MFTNRAQLKRRTPDNGVDRENYLSLLVDEYINTNFFDNKCQVLANLANFAYDPINYGYIRDVGVLDIFMFVLKNESNEKLLHFATAGICNLCNDPANIDYILQHQILKPLALLLKSSNSDIVADTITIFIYLNNSHAKGSISLAEVITEVKSLATSDNKTIGNLAKIFLEETK
ncbi:armadillo repeat-containing protein 7-like [Aricia agestis]|uniref:armadillo repeat-containing protein 7-like n=1 Tax=Aricia agestis TaxID=91739 RepID=UPI001C20BD41|nr:armadillo repeat-containing protein 7-like [Aricia agestis]